MEQETIIIVSCFAAAWLVLLFLILGLFVRVHSLRKLVREMQVTGRLRVQKLKMNPDKNHAFHNPGLVPDEELSRRGFTMYSPDDVESASRIHERQTGGQFVEELSREIDQRQQRLRQQDDRRPDSIDHESSLPPRQDSFVREPSRPSRSQSPVRNKDHRRADSYTREISQDSFIYEPTYSRDNNHSAPPFLLQSIEENKRMTRSLMNPNANPNHGRPSDTNPNFIY